MVLPENRAAALQTYYDEMSAARKRIVGPLVIFTLFAFFLQQFLTNFTSVMDGLVFAGLTWAYLYGFALFFLVVALTMYYTRAISKVEAAHRPDFLDANAVEQYQEWREWESQQAELEREEAVRDELYEKELADEIRRAHGKETGK